MTVAAIPSRVALAALAFVAAALLGPTTAGAASFRSGASATTGGSTALVVAAPAGTRSGDVLVAGIDVRLDGWRAITPPAGWTLVRRDSDGGAGATLSQALYYHVAGGSEPFSYGWSWGVSRAAVGAVLAYTGVDTANAIVTSSGRYTQNSSVIVAPSVTTPAAGETVLAFFGSNGAHGIAMQPGLLERSDAAAGGAVEAAASDYVQASAGTTGDKRASEPQSNSSNIGQLVALRNAGTSTTTATAPSNTSPPVISGTAQQGQTLSVSNGTWSGTTPMAGAYQWLRCNSSGASCSPIGGATAQTYVVASVDVNATLRATVTMSNSAGSASASSAQTSLVVGSASTLGSALPPLLPQSTGTTYYVDGGAGNDANSGLSAASAFRTIQHALNVVQAGQTVVVRGGSYVESPVMKGLGTASAPITIKNYPGETVLLEPQSCSCDNEGFQFDGAAYVRLQGFVIENTKGTSSTNLYVYGGSNHIQIEANELRYSQDQGTFVDSTTSYVYYIANRIHDNGRNHVSGQHQSHGIYIEGSHDLVANNLLYNEPYGFGIQIYPQNHDTIVVDNTIVANGHSGVVVGGSGGVYNITIRNNILAFNSSYGVEMDSSCPTGSVLIDHNVVYGNPAGAVEGGCGAVNTSGGNVLADPLFVNYGARDLHLQAGSPAIDRAAPDWSTSTDVAGAARPKGPGPDIGAYEAG